MPSDRLCTPRRSAAERSLSGTRAGLAGRAVLSGTVDVGAVVDPQDFHGVGVGVDPVHHPVATAPRRVGAGEWRVQRFADPLGWSVIGPSMNSRQAHTTAEGSRCRFRRTPAAKTIRYRSVGTGRRSELGPQLLHRRGAAGSQIRFGFPDFL